MKSISLSPFLSAILTLLGASALVAAQANRPVEGISDNSFFIEEAYNQEPGVVQNIFTGFYGRDKRRGTDDESWDFAFTQEWPVFTQTHQFSYTVPYGFVRGNAESTDGFGDVLLNYRYQAFLDERTLTAFAPRLSLILPTGAEERGFGEDTVGGQINLPFSTTVGDRWFIHLNAGTTFLPDAASADERDLWHFSLGASVVYAATHDLHFLCEWIGNWEEGLNEVGKRTREFSSVVSPGMRKAFNFANDSQLVLGVAAPVGLTGTALDYGAFLYVSFEHFFKRPAK